ncbi:MAG: plastocyanin/azurin family copper-binding protein [Hyphomicrobiales bacterium]
MKLSKLTAYSLIILSSAVLNVTTSFSETHEVLMLDIDPDNFKRKMVFSPKILKINAGDTVKFLATNSGHNVQSDDSAIPPAAQTWNSPIGKDFEMVFTEQGTYSYFCTPHRAMGMVGLILVGDYKLNWDQVKASEQPGKARIYLNRFYEDIEASE